MKFRFLFVVDLPLWYCNILIYHHLFQAMRNWSAWFHLSRSRSHAHSLRFKMKVFRVYLGLGVDKTSKTRNVLYTSETQFDRMRNKIQLHLCESRAFQDFSHFNGYVLIAYEKHILFHWRAFRQNKALWSIENLKWMSKFSGKSS